MKEKLNWLFVAGHIITGIYLYLGMWWVLPLGLLIFHVGHGAFAHRIFMHGAGEARFPLLGHLLFNMCAWGSALTFSAVHANHHRYSGTELDPHEPKYQGKWNIFIGNYCLNACMKTFKRLARQPYAMWFHKNYFRVAVLSLPLAAPVMVVSFWLRYLLLVYLHDAEDDSTASNKWWLWPILWGEEMHEKHHSGAKLHHKLDLIGGFVCLMRKN